MGSGKTTWAKQLVSTNFDKNFLYITPTLELVEAFRDDVFRDSSLEIREPKNKGAGKIGNIADLLESSQNIASTHELFKRFDSKCIEALKANKYTLILDETIDAVEPYFFKAKDDYKYLLQNQDIKVDANGMITWIGSDLDTRFDDVRILAKNNCLFKVDDKFFLWHYPHEIFNLFEEVYVLTYLFDGSLMKYYFDLYGLQYQIKSLNKEHEITDYVKPNKGTIKQRIKVYDGNLNTNLRMKYSGLSSTYCKSSYNKPTLKQLKNNLYNYCQHVIKAQSEEIMWTTFKSSTKSLSGKGYTKGFVACNYRGSNEYVNKTCLMYCVNWFVNPEIEKFFKQHNIIINQDAIALSSMLQWIWRSNIRNQKSEKIINIYIPSERMRQLFLNWLHE